ncbi:unnamed protein product [Symbiodinium microadriaticum]|nr:unnamed protein product [Symbiodinium microadriaticum]
MLDELIADNDSGEGLPHEVRRQANENNTPEEGDETGLFELSGIMEQEREGQHIEEVPQEVQRQASENNTPEEGAEVGLISLPGTILSSYFAMTMGQGDEEQEPDFMQVGYRIISRWRNRGLSLQSATNFLLSLADDRDDGEYMEDYSQHLSQLGLPTEARDNPVELQDEQSDVLVWLEAELWLNWIDYLEGRTGWESEAVRSNRARTTGLDPRDMQGWRDWADALAFPREPPTRPSFRVEKITVEKQKDIEIMQQGMLRVLAMLMIECSQLLMRHPFFQPPHERDNDDNLLMQTSMLKKERKEKDNFEEEVLDMANEENTFRAEREARDKQQEEEEAWMEKFISEEDEAAWKQWESHQAQRYREWEQWAVLNSVPREGTKKRLRVTTQRNGHLQQTDMEVAMGSEVSIYLGPLVPSSASQSSWEAPSLDVDTILNNMYDLWKKGKIGDETVISLAGIDVLGLYNAQLHKEVETMDTMQDQDKDSSGSTK